MAAGVMELVSHVYHIFLYTIYVYDSLVYAAFVYDADRKKIREIFHQKCFFSIQYVGCNNGIGGFNENLVTFWGTKLPGCL